MRWFASYVLLYAPRDVWVSWFGGKCSLLYSTIWSTFSSLQTAVHTNGVLCFRLALCKTLWRLSSKSDVLGYWRICSVWNCYATLPWLLKSSLEDVTIDTFIHIVVEVQYK